MTENKTISFWHPAQLIATWGGVGLIPKAPGTWGSFAALPFIWLCMEYGGKQAVFAFAIITFAIGWWVSNVYMAHTGIDGDPKEIVIDEVSGQALMVALLSTLTGEGCFTYITAFVSFRAFDVIKPWPIGWFDRHIKGGFGIMIDDTLAAIYPALVFYLTYVLLPVLAQLILGDMGGA